MWSYFIMYKFLKNKENIFLKKKEKHTLQRQIVSSFAFCSFKKGILNFFEFLNFGFIEPWIHSYPQERADLEICVEPGTVQLSFGKVNSWRSSHTWCGPWGQAGTQLVQGHSLLLPWARRWKNAGGSGLGASGAQALGQIWACSTGKRQSQSPVGSLRDSGRAGCGHFRLVPGSQLDRQK